MVGSLSMETSRASPGSGKQSRSIRPARANAASTFLRERRLPMQVSLTASSAAWYVGHVEEHCERTLAGDPNHQVRSLRSPANPEHAVAALQQPLRHGMK